MNSEEQCEAWINEANRRIEEKGFIPLTSHTMQWMRAAWKASRESLVVVDIDEPSIRGMTSEQHMGAMIAVERIRKAIHAAGVRTK